MELNECKAKILYGQHLTNPRDSFTVCRDLNGVQAQFMSAAEHSLSIRTTEMPEQFGKGLVIKNS